MGQSHTTESASDTENDSSKPRGAASSNFFGLFGGKKDEYIDSTDSDITIEERKNSKSNKKAKKHRERIVTKRPNRISTNKSPPERGKNSPNTLQSKGRITCNTSKQSACRNQPCISDFNNSNRKSSNSANNCKVIGCRERSRERSSLVERKACNEEKRTDQHSGGDRLNKSITDLTPTKEIKSEKITVCSGLFRNNHFVNSTSTNKFVESKTVHGSRENQRNNEPNPCGNSISCIDKQSQSKFCHRCSQNTNGIPSRTESTCSKCGLSRINSRKDGKPSPQASVCDRCCDAPIKAYNKNTDGCKNTNGNCENRSESNGDKSVQTANKKPSASATTIDSDVMNDYPRYSREPPEREQNVCGFTQHNMRSCCRSCCAQKKLDAPGCNIKPKYQKFCSNRPISDSYVAHNQSLEKSNPTQSRSAPINCQKGKTYPPASRVPPEQRSKIPLPPPPPTKDCQNRRSRQFDAQPSPVRENNLDNSKQMYNPHNYNYNKQHYKNSYPYEEPPDTFSYSRETCCAHNCSGYEHCSQHSRCKCQCMCESSNYYPRRNISDDQLSGCSDSTKTDFMNLAYQRTGDYPELVDELENTLSQRNRMRVQKTMEQFEILSRQNKNLDRPIFDDEESCRHHHNSQSCNDCKCSCCKESDSKDSRKTDNDAYKSRSESLTKRSSFQANTLPRKSGYVEKVARCMDPNLNRKGGKHMSPPPFCNPNKNSNQRGNGTWKMDSRKGEWVKVGDGSYDFESSYPPLPPRPRSGHVYEDRSNRREYSNRNSDMERPCSCSKCSRHNR